MESYISLKTKQTQQFWVVLPLCVPKHWLLSYYPHQHGCLHICLAYAQSGSASSNILFFFLFFFFVFLFLVSLEPGTLRLLMKHCVAEQQPSPSQAFSQACCHRLCHRWLLPSLQMEFDTLPPQSLSSSYGLTLGMCTDSHTSLLDSYFPFRVWSLIPVACLVPARPLKRSVMA